MKKGSRTIHAGSFASQANRCSRQCGYSSFMRNHLLSRTSLACCQECPTPHLFPSAATDPRVLRGAKGAWAFYRMSSVTLPRLLCGSPAGGPCFNGNNHLFAARTARVAGGARPVRDLVGAWASPAVLVFGKHRWPTFQAANKKLQTALGLDRDHPFR